MKNFGKRNLIRKLIVYVFRKEKSTLCECFFFMSSSNFYYCSEIAPTGQPSSHAPQSMH